MSQDAYAGAMATLANAFAWIAHTEQIWFPTMGAYLRYLQPIYDLPDMRGPFAFVTLAYIGLRLGDLWNKREEITDL